MSGLSQFLPDSASLLAQRDLAHSGTAQLMATLGSLRSGDDRSPVGAALGVFGQVRARLDIDISGLADDLPRTLTTVRNAIPAGVVDYLATVDAHYAQARAFLVDSPLARAVEQDELQSAALAVIDDALALFRSRLAGLVGGVFPASTLAEIADVLAAFEHFHGDFAAHRAEFLPFLARYLVGVAPDLLAAPLGHLDEVTTALDAAGPAALDAALDALRDAADAAFAELVGAVTALDAADAAGYARIDAALSALETASGALLDALPPAYAAAQSAADSPVWRAALSAYATALDAVALDRVPSIDDVVSTIDAALGDLLARLLMTFGPEDVAGRLELLTRAMRDTLLSSPLGQARRTLAAFLGDIRGAVEQIPTELIQQTVEQLLGRVRQELEALGIADLGDRIAAGFEEARAFIVAQLNDQVVNPVREGLRAVSEQARALPIGDLVANLNGAIAQLQTAIAQLEQLVAEQIDGLRALLAQLDSLSYEPISGEVIGEIDQLKARLAAINPSALSEPEKLAIRAALAVLDAIDLKGQIGGQLKPAYHSAEAEVKRLLDDITAALHQFRDQIDVFSPDALLRPVRGLMDQVTGALDGLNGHLATAPITRLVDELLGELGTLSPAALLDPLVAPYAEVLRVVDQLDPARWLEPLQTVYAEIDALIAKVDITPLLAELEARRAAIFAEARAAVLDGLGALAMPEPLGGFVAQLTPLVAAFTDALFGDVAAAAPQIAVDLRAQFSLGSLFAPLDAVFDRLVGLLSEVPPDEVVAALEGLRLALGVGFARLDPAALRDGLSGLRAALDERAPAVLFGGPLRLPPLRAAFEARVVAAPAERQQAIVALRARFDAVVQITAPGVPASRLANAQRAHAALSASLDRAIAEATVERAALAYGRVREQLDRVLPSFLRQTTPLTFETALAGISALRPSAKAATLDARLAQFVAQAQPVAEQVAELTNSFFGVLRDAVQLINPLTLRDDVAAIYDAIRAKVRVIDPERFAASIREDLLDPIMAPLRALDPAALKVRLQALYEGLLGALRTGARAIADQIAAAIDEVLAVLRAQARALIQQIEATIALALHAVEDILAQIEGLVFVEILGRLRALIDRLGASFDRELDRILNAFDEMLHAAPLGGSASVEVGAP